MSEYDKYAVARAAEFANGQNFFHAYIEKPAMYEQLPDLQDKNVLCVGCGTGEECLELQTRGAKVTAFDSSPASVTFAKEHVDGVSFDVVDMDDRTAMEAYGSGQFDLIYSSMVLHYSNDLEHLLKSLHNFLKPGGNLLFSVGHPLRWASRVSEDVSSALLGYVKHPDHIDYYGNYLETQQFSQQLADGPRVIYWMRPPSAYFKLLAQTGFVIKDFIEPQPTPEGRDVNPITYELRSKMPINMIFQTEKAV
jgi:SAM-dependent methyltransferase